MSDFFTPPRLRGQGRYRASRFALPVGTGTPATPEFPDLNRGVFGTGIGPDFDLGISTMFNDLGKGVTSLAALLAPGSKAGEPGADEFVKGSLSSIGGTLVTAGKPLIEPLDAVTPGDLEGGIERGIGRFLGDEEQYRARDLMEGIRERGLLPAVVEHVGNAAIVGTAVTAPWKAASTAARFGGATETSARLAAIHGRLIENPLIHAVQHPYRTAGRAIRESALAPAKARVLESAGIVDVPLDEAPIDFLAAELPDTGVDYRQVRVDMDEHRARAEAYNALPDDDPAAHAAYQAFADEIEEQYRHVTEDLGIQFEFTPEDPYPSYKEMLADVRENKRLKVYKTGEGEHPFLTPEQNDKFRAVHDLYGHAATGRDFSRHGEEAAFLAHSSMFGPEAQKAMATETRGQNSVLITSGEFGPQKVGLLPDDLSDPAAAIARFQKSAPKPPPGATTQLLARMEGWMEGREAARKALEETRRADMEKKIAARSPAVRTAVTAARDHLMDAGRAQGINISRKEASLIIGDEIRSRLTGIKALEEEYLARGVPEDVFVSAGIRERFIPTPLRTPEMETALAAAVEANLAERANVRATLLESRVGERGLVKGGADDAMEPALTKAQQKTLAAAQRKLDRAHSEILERKAGRERASREKYVAAENDRLGRIAAAAGRIDDEVAQAVAEFDHSRTWTPKAWRGAGAMEASAQAIFDRTLANVVEHNGEWGGASFNPHTGRFVEGGKDTGYAVGLVPGTALEVPFEEFSPAHIEQVIRAYQDVYQHPGTIVGTWVEDGTVYIDPSEIVDTMDDAIVRGAARAQLSTYDIAGDNVVGGILKDRPDVAVPFIDRHRNLSKRTAELRDIAKKTAMSDEDVNLAMGLLMRQAVRAQDLGLVKHPDDFFRKHVSKFEFAKRPSRRGVPKDGSRAAATDKPLFQIVLERSAETPEQRASLWREVEANVADLGKVRRWYHDSHDLVERLFRNQPDVTLLDGTKINPADLFYQFLAATSFQAAPRDNFTRAMVAMQRFDDLPRKEMSGLIKAMKKVTAGKATLEEAFGLADVAEGMRGFGLYPEPRQYLAEIIAGRTIDKWGPEHFEEAYKAFGQKGKPPERAKALAFIEDNYPDLIERIGEDAAIKEFWSRKGRAKIITFWDNLQNPETSLGVTMDQQMERIFGAEVPLTGGDGWIRYSEQVRDLADELSQAMGERVMPHEIQAALWVFAKDEIARIQQGHFRALAADAQDMVREGTIITDEADPVLQYLAEASEPYRRDEQRVVMQHRILRDETEPPKTPTPPISHSQSPLDYGTGQPALRMEIRDPSAGPSKSLTYFADPELLGFIDYTPNLRRPGETYIHFISTRPEARGRGLSRALVEKLYEITGDDAVDFGSIEAPEVEVLRQKMREAHPDKGNYGKPAPGVRDEAQQHLAARPKRPGEKVENIVYRPGWGALSRDKKVALFDKRKVKWLAERDEINASIAVGDIDAAVARMNKFVSDMMSKAPRSLGLADEGAQAGGSFMDIWMKGEFHSAGFVDAANALDRLDVPPGEMPPLLQAFRDKVLGEFVPLDDGTRGVIRIFEDGNLATLVHENGHLLRRILPESEMRAVERSLGVKDGVWTVAHEEAFANDFLNYMTTNKAPKGLGSTFARVREALADIWQMVRGTFQRRRVHPELATVFDSWLDPEVRAIDEAIPGLPDISETGTMAQRGARPPRLPQPPAGTRDFFDSGRKGAQALARIEKLAARKKALNVAKVQTEKNIAAVRQVLDENRLPSELERDALIQDASKMMERVNEELGVPSIKRTPARWQPLWDAVQRLGKEAEANPELAGIFEDLPQTLHDAQNLALNAGFDPAHVRDFTPAQVRRLVFGNMRLGMGRDVLHEAQAGTRKARSGVLAKAGGVDRSVEALLAATVEAVAEKRTNMVVDWVEQKMARTIPQGTPIPDGWTLWDPVRTYLLTGTELSDDGLRAVQTSAQNSMIVPTPVVKTLDRFSKDYDHWAWRAIRKVTSPWRTLVLTLSPGWYTRNVVGNIILATAEGVNLQDWAKAWKSARTKDEIGRFADLPFVSGDTLAQEALVAADETVIPRRGFREAAREDGRLRGTAHHAARKMLRVNEVVDEFARAAVYHKGRRMNLTPEAAWDRAKEALVDYNALSPFERSAVRAVVPFYAWQKGILKVTINQAIDHPARVGVLSLLGQLQDDYIADRFGVESQDVPEFYKHLIGGQNVRSFNPFADPSEIVTVEGITRSLNPFLELAVRKGLGAPEFYSDQQRLGFFGTAQQDVDVPSALGEMVTRSPGGRILGQGPGQNLLGLGEPVDDADLRSRFLRARRQIRNIPNPETGSGGAGSFLPPRLRSAA